MANAKQVKFEKAESGEHQMQACGAEDMVTDVAAVKTVASTGTGNDTDQPIGTSKKEYRKRIKGLLSAIKKQMEFYFGDANINKDRMMREYIESAPDGYLPIALFLTFNKIKKLTDSTYLIARALKKSDLLELSDHRTKVRRTCRVHYMTQEEVDARTIYVEGLPKHADHDWISSHFSACGKVAYISLPHYKQTGDNKGFAFVEFETPEEAAKVVEMMSKVPEETGDDQKVGQSVKTLKNLKYWRNKAIKEGLDPDKVVENPPTETLEDTGDKKPYKKQKKRKCRTSELAAEENGQSAKKVKVDSADGEVKSAQTTSASSSSKDSESDVSKDKLTTGAIRTTKSESGRANVQDQQDGVKRKRKSENATKEGEDEMATKISKTFDEAGETFAGDTVKKAVKGEADSTTKDQDPRKKKQKVKLVAAGRQSLEKDAKDSSENKKRKRKSVDKPETAGMKRSRKDTSSAKDESQAVEGENEKKKKRRKKRKVKKEPFKLKVMSKAEWTKLKREYLDQQRASMANLKKQLKARQTNSLNTAAPHTGEHQLRSETKQAPCPAFRSAPEFIPDVIVAIKSETGMFYKQLKEQIDPSISVAYVDVKDNQLSGYIRCKDAESARRLAAAGIPRCTLTLVQGDAEKAYWDKMVQDRENTLQNKKRRKKRGSSKLLEKAQNATMESMQKNRVLFDED